MSTFKQERSLRDLLYLVIMNFKHGDKVTCYIEGEYIDDAMISIDSDRPYICQNIRYGLEAEDKLGYKYSFGLNRDFTEMQVKNLKLADTRTEITWDNLQEGDVIVSKDGIKNKILFVGGKMVYHETKTIIGYSCNKKDNLIRAGYTIKQPTPSQPIPDEVQKAIEHLQANGYKVTKE